MMENQASGIAEPSALNLGERSAEKKSHESDNGSPVEELQLVPKNKNKKRNKKRKRNKNKNKKIEQVFGNSVWESIEESFHSFGYFEVTKEKNPLEPFNQVCINDMNQLTKYRYNEELRATNGHIVLHNEFNVDFNGNAGMSEEFRLSDSAYQIPIKYGHATDYEFIMFLVDFNVPISAVQRPSPENEKTVTVEFLNQLERFQMEYFKEKVMNKRKRIVDILSSNGTSSLIMGDIQKAKIYMELVIEIDPKNSKGWQRLGIFYAENNEITLAIEYLNESLKLQPNNPEVMRCLAICHLNNNDFEETYRMFMELLKRNPKYKDIVDSNPLPDERRITNKHLFTKKLNETVKDMYTDAVQRNVELEYNDVDVYINFGIFLYINNDYEEAIICFKDALKINPKDAFVWSSLGAALAKDEKMEKSMEAYREALKINPGFVKARYNLGNLCIYLGTYREATDQFIIALNYQETVMNHSKHRNELWENIWTSLKLAVTIFEKHDLLKAVEKRDLAYLNKKFLQIGEVDDEEEDKVDYIIKYLTKK